MKWRSYVEVERHLLKNCKSLHSLPLVKVDRRAVATRICRDRVNSGAVTANRTRASLSAFFAWCMREGLLDSNPVIGTSQQPEKSRDRVLSDSELKIIWDTLGHRRLLRDRPAVDADWPTRQRNRRLALV